ncbi:MAG: FecR domain-containing protein [Kofleriaceae bacterium]
MSLRDLRDRIPVEPLSDERMTNIERNIVVAASDAAQATPARGPMWLGFAVIAAAMIAVGVTSWKLASSNTPPTVAVESPIHVDTTEGTKLDIGDARLASAPGTKFVVTRPAGGVLVEMTRGKVELEVGTRGTRPPLVVRAGETDVVVVGTRFSVDYGDGTGEVVVIVTEGAVNVRKRSLPESAVRVAIGQAWTTTRGQIAITDLPATQVAAAGSTVTAPVERADIEMDPAPPNTPAHADTDGSDGSDEVTNGGANRPGKKKVVVYEHDPRKALLGAPIQPALDVGIADPRAALMEHMKVAGSGRGDDAARAMYSVAYLQSRVLKDPTAALKTLDIYMARFIKKNRSEHADALWLRVRILCEKTFDDACRRAARIYSEAAPSTNKSGIADSILATPP